MRTAAFRIATSLVTIKMDFRVPVSSAAVRRTSDSAAITHRSTSPTPIQRNVDAQCLPAPTSGTIILIYLFDLFIYSGYFYSASLKSTILLRGVPDTARILCRSFMPKRHRQL